MWSERSKNVVGPTYSFQGQLGPASSNLWPSRIESSFASSPRTCRFTLHLQNLEGICFQLVLVLLITGLSFLSSSIFEKEEAQHFSSKSKKIRLPGKWRQRIQCRRLATPSTSHRQIPPINPYLPATPLHQTAVPRHTRETLLPHREIDPLHRDGARLKRAAMALTAIGRRGGRGHRPRPLPFGPRKKSSTLRRPNTRSC